VLDPDYTANYHLRGRALAKAGQYDAAIEDFSRALEANPRLALARIDRGLAYQAMGDLVQAITDFTWAILINPSQPEAYNLRGIAYTEAGLWSEAIADYNRAISLDPTNAAYWNNRAWAQLQLNNHAGAQLDFLQFLLRLNLTLPRALLEAYDYWFVPDLLDTGEARG